MISIQEFIKNLQNKPAEVRNRLFVGSSAIAIVLVVGIWFMNFKHDVKNLAVSSATSNSTVQSAPHYVSVDAKESKGSQTLVYFSIKNDTTDILNLPKSSDIKLQIGDKSYAPNKLTDRTGNDFVVKALSNSQVFGIAAFDSVSGSNGQITFDNLFFEQSASTIFKETLNINLNKLSAPQSPGN